jgi:GNAT superfamily N-acetyltransferase
MPGRPLILAQATDHDADVAVIAGLIQQAASWLRTMRTDQWARPWPNQTGLHGRIRLSLQQGRTWICWDGDLAAATITADPDADPYWGDAVHLERAVYVHRLVVSRHYAGRGLGAALLDWAGRTARRDHGAQWIRVSAWTTNEALHAYYVGQGFVFCGLHPDDGYPSAARFQKPTGQIQPQDPTLFREA